MTEDSDIVINGKRALINQLLIGIAGPIILIGGALWGFSGQWATAKTNIGTVQTRSITNESEIKEIKVILSEDKTDERFAEVITTLKFLKEGQDRILIKIESMENRERESGQAGTSRPVK